MSGMTDFSDTDKASALHAIADMIERAEKAQAKFAAGTSQHSLQVHRIHALRVARTLLCGDATLDYTSTDLERARAPLASLATKSEKAQGKLDESSWQYKMLRNNLAALSLASKLLEAKLAEEQT